MIPNDDENNAGLTEQPAEHDSPNPDSTEGAPGNEPTTHDPTENEGASKEASSDTTENAPQERRPRRRGFAAMDRDRVREIASKGGKAAHAAGTAHQFSSDEARVAGRKGGMAPHVRRGGVRRRAIEGGAATPPPAHEEHGVPSR